mgnify:CR=1 FL=1
MRRSLMTAIPGLLKPRVSERSPILNGLISYWKLDEETGTRFDSHGSNHMTPQGNATYAPGIMGNALDPGEPATGYTTGAPILIPETGFTVWAWKKLSDISARAGIVQGIREGTGSTSWYLVHYQQNSWRFGVGDSSGGGVFSFAINTTSSAVDTWFFVCGRYNPATKKAEIRVNNSAWAVASDALANGPLQTVFATQIGRYAAGSTVGLTDSVGISGRYLSDEEVDMLYNEGAGLEYPFLGTPPAEPAEVYTGPEWYVVPNG